MIVPNFSFNYDGDIVFEFTNLSESIKEAHKKPYDRNKYISSVTINPIGDEVINKECECPGFMFRGECKHITQNIKKIEELLNIKHKSPEHMEHRCSDKDCKFYKEFSPKN